MSKPVQAPQVEQVVRLWRNESAIDDALKSKDEDWDLEDEMNKGVTDPTDDEYAVEKQRTLRAYLQRQPVSGCFRWSCQYLTESKYLKRYLTGLDLDISVVDSCVTTLTLVNALVLTIPFSVLVDLGWEFWETLHTIMTDNGCEEWYDYYYTHTRNNQLMILYASIAGIVIAVAYFIFRPDFDERSIDIDSKLQLETLQSLLDFHVSGTPMTEEMIDRIINKQFYLRKVLADYKFKAWWIHGRHAVLAIFVLTASAVISLLSFSFILISIFMVREEDLCKFENTPISSAFLGASGLIAVYCIVRLNQTAKISDTDKSKLRKMSEYFSSGVKPEKEEEAPIGKNCCCFPEVQPERSTQAAAAAAAADADISKDPKIVPN
jgi:hypothetical protein